MLDFKKKEMMKNIFFRVVVTAVAALYTVSCTDLEENPEGVLEGNVANTFFGDPVSVQRVVDGAYNQMAAEEYYGRKLPLTLMLRGDMVTIGDQTTPSRRIQIDDFTANSLSAMLPPIWNRSLLIIANANSAITGINNLDEKPDELLVSEAQARFLRAFVYYHMVRVFGPVPFLSGEIIIEENGEIGAGEQLERDTEEFIYERIIEDLEFARDNLPDTVDGISGARPSRGTALAYLASVNLTLGNWQEAYGNAKSVIDNAAVFGYALAADFQDVFDSVKSETTPENIFVVDFTGADALEGNLSTDFLAPLTGLRGIAPVEGWSVAVPTLDVFNSFEDGDYRKETSFVTESDEYPDGIFRTFERFAEGPRGTSRPHIDKYWSFTGGLFGGNRRDSDLNYIGIRYAEVLLIAAEASNQLNGPNAEAIGYVNQIRERARNGAVGSVASSIPADLSLGSFNQESLQEAIIEERRVELAFEFKRWYDIKRLQIGEEVFGAGGFEEQSNFNPSRDYLFPVPSIVLDNDPTLAPQNPGY